MSDDTRIYGTPDDAHPTQYFSGFAGDYARFRPSYADAAIDALLEGVEPPARVLDVGCGTGISTRLLAARGARVIGLDPSNDMLAEARRVKAQGSGGPPEQAEPSLPSPHDPSALGDPHGSDRRGLRRRDTHIDYHLGTAEETGQPNASRDVVVCAQSFHWFDAERALKELHRVLMRGGRLALLWNMRDEADPFVAEYDQVVRRAQAAAKDAGRKVEVTRDADPTAGGWFENVRVRAFPNPHRLDLAALLGRAASASYFPKTGPLRAELERALEDAFHRHARDGVVALAQRTELTLADRVERRR